MDLQASVRLVILETMVIQGVTKAELARRLGVSRANVTQMFKRDRQWSLRTLESLATCLNLSVDVKLRKIENENENEKF